MLRIGALWVMASGCAQLFGLERPEREIESGPSSIDPLADAALPAPPDDAAAEPDAAPALACPSSYTAPTSAGTRYRYNQFAGPWTLAAADCADDGTRTHLIVIGSESERQLVLQHVAKNEPIWIGLTDRTSEGMFRWVTAEPSNYPPPNGSPWGTGEPSGDDCTYMASSGVFRDDNCFVGNAYVCECDYYPNVPAHYQ